MYYTVKKQSGHLRTLKKCGKHLPVARVFYISFVISNAHHGLSQCNTQFRLYLLRKKGTNMLKLSQVIDEGRNILKEATVYKNEVSPMVFC